MKKSTTYKIDGIRLSDLIEALGEIEDEQGSDAVISGVSFELERTVTSYGSRYTSDFAITIVDELEDRD